MATKSDFKSLSWLSCQNQIELLFWRPFSDSLRFTKVTSRCENEMWKKNKLKHFKLQSKDIDRVYHIEMWTKDDINLLDDACYMLAARQIYDDKPLYVLLIANYAFNRIWGYIYMSFDAQYFLSSILYPNGYYEDKIYMLMKEDGFAVKKPLSEFDHMPPKFHHLPLSSMRSAPSLQFLCHLKIYQERKLLDSAKNIFPKPFYNSVVDIITSLDNYYKMKDKMDYHTPWF
uniref:Uncharacterized protein n=1 Tax=Trachysalambria curvirostris majanivirus TaxID=2984281 RepID=A0A9C7BWQ6_9VIRU|nr:MAG: hypothetical protein [Trachysalambria curvirostris majanivirus]